MWQIYSTQPNPKYHPLSHNHLLTHPPPHTPTTTHLHPFPVCGINSPWSTWCYTSLKTFNRADRWTKLCKKGQPDVGNDKVYPLQG